MEPEVIFHGFRVVFGLIFLFFVPGYALTLALFPKKEFNQIERIGFAGVLSIIADILTTLYIDIVLNVPTNAINIFLSLLTLTSISLLLWYFEIKFEGIKKLRVFKMLN